MKRISAIVFSRHILLALPVIFLLRTFGFGVYRVPTSSMETTMLVGERVFAEKVTPLFGVLGRGDVVTFNDPAYVYSDNGLVRLLQRYLWGPRNFTKRVIGVPGDLVQGRVEDGVATVYLNGKRLDEPYVNRAQLIPVSTSPEQWRSFDPEKPWDKQPWYSFDPDRVKKAQKDIERLGRPTVYDARALLADNKDVFEVKLGADQYWLMGDTRYQSKDSRTWGPVERMHIHGKVVCYLWMIQSDHAWWIADLIAHPIDFWSKVRFDRFLKRVA